MKTSSELERPFEAEALRDIERSLRAKLRSHQLSESFIERNCEDAIQRGVLEYLRALEEGVEVECPAAFVVQAAFCRAVDELRHEARFADGATVEALLESRRFAVSPADEVAVDHVAAQELREAIESLPAEERQALGLRYFEEVSDRRGAELLYCSERTYRRLLAKAMRKLSRRLGVPVPEPGSQLAIEIGLLAWVSLRGARVPVSSSLPEQVVATLDTARGAASWLLERLRELATRLGAGDAGERIGAVASGPAGKLAGGCAGAAVLCVLGGAVGANLGGTPDLLGIREHEFEARQGARVWHPIAPRPLPATSTEIIAGGGDSAERRNGGESQRSSRQTERRQVWEQTSGTARVASESSSSPSGASSSGGGSESVTVVPSSGSGPAPSEEEQADQQFGPFK